MAKKKKTVDENALFKNGMHVERTKQSAIQGGMLLVYMCVLGVFSYIVSMIPAGIFGVFVANGSTTNQSIYDIQNILLTVIGLLIICIGGYILSKKVGENDAMIAFRYKLERKADMRYLLISLAIAVVVFVFVGAVCNIDFFIGPAKYLGIFLCRAERSINEGIKVSIGFRLIAMLICMAFDVPVMLKGLKDGFNEKMKSLSDIEAEEAAKAAEKTASETK
ncbi:MAG: hypothetical protein ACI4XJ_04265 [Eubacteriales bacterium]